VRTAFDGAPAAVQMRLHSELPPSRVWAYDGLVPGPTIEVRRGQRLRICRQNEIAGEYPVIAVEVPNVDAATFYVDYNGWNSGRSSMPARWHTQSTFTRTGALPVHPTEQGLEGRDPGRGRAAGPHRRAGVWGKRRYVYHCHILEHEDEGMMRTFVVTPKEVMAIDPHITDGHHPLQPA
jgi:FtsP/CotA-like multicopper oxidase with cupredoxin domain